MLKPTLSFSTVILKAKENVLQIKHTSGYLGFVLIFGEYSFSQSCSKPAWTSKASLLRYLCTSNTRDGLTQWPGPSHCWVLVLSHPVWLAVLPPSQHVLVFHQFSINLYEISGRGGGSTRRHTRLSMSSLSSMPGITN